ncbi:MAG: MFS transporter [Aquabacterium sp.]|uniref:MFS transporter n=1 Tax=Aquabacterium sp. TaxID=1872578 RepID=UPI00121C9B4E|nr:MFS transporter [Aquabacterium sp.]TAK92273.1 MAG: MFS transporter [Aquabacterium sp.]
MTTSAQATTAPTTTLLVKERLLLWSLAAINFTHIVDFMVMMPLGPQLTKLFHLTDAQFGLLVSAYSLAAGVSGLMVSMVIDRFERKRALLWVYAGFALATLACGLAPSYGALMAARVAAGVFGGVLGALVQTIVGDAVPFERRGQAMGLVMSAFSLSTVAGVPLSLWMASVWGWHMPFFAIAAASVLVWLAAWRSVPLLRSHMAGVSAQPPIEQLRRVLAEPNHWRAFALSMLMLTGSFSIIPYITIYTTTNVGLSQDQVPYVYLAGGLATLFTARLWGRLTDRWGKVPVFRLISLGAVLPMLALTHLPVVPVPVLLVVTTAFFVFVSGRMVPGMALLTAAPEPAMRGSFMSVNGALQSAAMGVSAWVGGLMISRTPDGLVEGYGRAGWLALVATLIMVWWVGHLRLHTQGKAA